MSRQWLKTELIQDGNSSALGLPHYLLNQSPAPLYFHQVVERPMDVCTYGGGRVQETGVQKDVRWQSNSHWSENPIEDWKPKNNQWADFLFCAAGRFGFYLYTSLPFYRRDSVLNENEVT